MILNIYINIYKVISFIIIHSPWTFQSTISIAGLFSSDWRVRIYFVMMPVENYNYIQTSSNGHRALYRIVIYAVRPMQCKKKQNHSSNLRYFQAIELLPHTLHIRN